MPGATTQNSSPRLSRDLADPIGGRQETGRPRPAASPGEAGPAEPGAARRGSPRERGPALWPCPASELTKPGEAALTGSSEEKRQGGENGSRRKTMPGHGKLLSGGKG